jgi:uncharacterized protein
VNYKYRYLLIRKTGIIALSLLMVATAAVVGISYFVLAKVTFAGDRIIYGKSLSALAQHIRGELLKRPDIMPVSFESEDQFKLSGFVIIRENPTANLVMCHGYKSSKELLYGLIDIFPDWNIIVFDFRAHGQSEGAITSMGFHESKDVVAATNFLKKHTSTVFQKKLPCVVLGISMGAAASLKAAENHPDLCDALIIDSTYARLNSVVFKAFSRRSHLPLYPFFPIIKLLFHHFASCNMLEMNPEESVRHIHKPIYFIHALNDSYISMNNVLKLYANAKDRHSKLWVAPECRHGWLHSYYPELYYRKVTKFLAQANVLAK